jgi:TRAP-type C4-dicarboxylate transport system permease small subunit
LTLAEQLDGFCDRLNRITEFAIAVLLSATVVVTLLQVTFRYGLNSSLSWSEELARYLFIWIIFLGMASAARRGEHMAVTALSSILPKELLRPLAAFVILASIIFVAVVLYTTVLLTENATSQLSTALEVPVALVYVSAPIGATLTILHLLNALVRLATGGRPVLDAATDIS